MVVSSLKKFSVNSPQHTHERGQILLVVVLFMVVILTIGLSLATRNLTNLRQSSEEDSSQRAFSAAEAGLQVALQSDQSTGRVDFAEGTTYEAKVSAITARELALNGGNQLLRNESVDVWLSTYPGYTNQWSGRISLHWGDPLESQCPDTSAFEIAILSGTSVTNPSLTHYAVDPCNRGNNFTASGITQTPYTLDGRTYRYTLRLPQITNGYLMRIIPLYRNTRLAVAVTQGGPLPVQGKVIESVGISGNTHRKVVVVQGNPKVPLEIFPYVLFTPSAI